jgi:hypothetical protein
LEKLPLKLRFRDVEKFENLKVQGGKLPQAFFSLFFRSNIQRIMPLYAFPNLRRIDGGLLLIDLLIRIQYKFLFHGVPCGCDITRDSRRPDMKDIELGEEMLCNCQSANTRG